MSLFTEKEKFSYYNFQCSKIGALRVQDPKLFHEVIDFLPYNYYSIDPVDHNYLSFDKRIFSQGEEMEILYEKGLGYISEISNPFLLSRIRKKIELVSGGNMANANYFQEVWCHNQHKRLYTYKQSVGKNEHFHIALFLNNLGSIGKHLNGIFDDFSSDYRNWQRLSTLTFSEKRILRLLSNHSNPKDVADMLCISMETLRTHRRNIYRKMEINTTLEMIKVARVAELLELY